MAGKLDGFSFIEMVEDYIYMEDDISDRITEWARSHCSTFVDKDPRSVEQPLEHTQLHEDYSQLFESILEGFLSENEMSVKEFYVALAGQYELAESRQLELPVNATFAATLMSFTDFFSFCELMYDVNNGGDAIFCPPLLEIPADAGGTISSYSNCDAKSVHHLDVDRDAKAEYKGGETKAESK